MTPDEKRVFGQLFQAADSEGLGVVTGELAVKFFEKSGLNPLVLGEVRSSPGARMCPLLMLEPTPDLGNSGYRKPRTVDTCWIQCCIEIDWSSTSRSTSATRTCLTPCVSHILTDHSTN